ncbi:ACT domain-containing protein [Candidatus Micrarchaeota archaeon]|nr:ACT domain-containing protein [Candidatus Micrarchaeota archaeon]
MENISNIVALYIKQRPFFKEVLSQGVVNYSSLARKISMELNLKNEDAVKMALIRLSRKMERNESDLESKIRSVMKKSSMIVKNKVAVIMTSRKLDELKFLSFTQSGRHMTYIVEQRELDSMEKMPGRIEENLNLIIIESPEEVEQTPGFISYLLGALAAEGINVVEFISCYTDTILVLKQSETQKAYEILSTIMQ